MKDSYTIGIASVLLAGALVLPGCGRSLAGYPAPNLEKASEIRTALASKSAGSAAGGETQEAAKATGWGTIKGRFVYDGAPIKPAALSITKDADVCGKHPLVNESLLVSDGGALANVVLYARDRKIEVHPDYAASAKEKVVLDNHDCHFEPHIVAVRTGQPLEIKNSDPVGHNTNIQWATNSPFNGIIPAGSSSMQTMTGPEQQPATAVCNIHPWMKGYVVVQAHPYMAITGKDGAFELKNVPAGVPVEFQAWHEASTANNNALQAERPDLKWQANGRFTVTLKPDEVLDLKEIKVPAATLAVK
jgi:plastocyanin